MRQAPRSGFGKEKFAAGWMASMAVAVALFDESQRKSGSGRHRSCF